MPAYYIWTIGCQMNRAESERMASHLEAQGYRPAASLAQADFIVVNSCVVRQSAETRVTNKLDALRLFKRSRPDAVITLTGCLVETDTAALKTAYPHVDRFLKPGEYVCPEELPADNRAELPQHPGVCSYVPIMQGCNNFCSYCIVPYRRGREKSRPTAEIVTEVEELVGRGTRQVTLLGQNVDSYGRDLPGRPELAGLLHELNTIAGLDRIRFLTNHPKDMSPKLISAIASLEKVCEQVNLPVQSGDDDILKSMRRGYAVEQYRRLIADVRRQVPGIALSTDIIVGFPGETRAQFENTRDLLAELKFDVVHLAAYSPRPGTIAARELADDVPAEVKKARLAEIEELQTRIAAEINARLLGDSVEVLVEARDRGKWRGRTRTDKLVFFNDKADRSGKLVGVTISKPSPWSLQGSVAQ